jgi:hypothetical protein
MWSESRIPANADFKNSNMVHRKAANAFKGHYSIEPLDDSLNKFCIKISDK